MNTSSASCFSPSIQYHGRPCVQWNPRGWAPRACAVCKAANVNSTPEAHAQPWTITSYYTKQKTRQLNELGEIIQSPETVEEPLGWTDDGKQRLAVQIVSKELGRPEEEVTQKLDLLRGLLPDLPGMKVADLARLAVDLEEVAEKLLILRTALPCANVSRIVAGNTALLHMGKQELMDNLQQGVGLPASW